MMHNLTEDQLKTLRWIVHQVKIGNLKETFGSGFGDIDEIPEYINGGSLNALINSGILLYRSMKWFGEYTLTRIAYEIADFDYFNEEPDLMNAYIIQTHRLIQKHFNRDEFEIICFELGVNDWVFTDNPDRPHQLLLYLYRQNRLNELTNILREHRNNVDWPLYP